MFIPWTIRLSTGPALMPPCPSVHVSLSLHELHILARAIEREANQARADGLHGVADRLDWRVADLREAAAVGKSFGAGCNVGKRCCRLCGAR